MADFERHADGPFDELLERVDHLIVPRKFAADRTGTDDPPHAVQSLWTPRRAAVVVTCGPEGGWYRDAASDRVRHYEAPAVDPVNTTGCGDVFHGIYAGALARGADVEECIRRAVEAAARHAGGLGAV